MRSFPGANSTWGVGGWGNNVIMCGESHPVLQKFFHLSIGMHGSRHTHTHTHTLCLSLQTHTLCLSLYKHTHTHTFCLQSLFQKRDMVNCKGKPPDHRQEGNTHLHTHTYRHLLDMLYACLGCINTDTLIEDKTHTHTYTHTHTHTHTHTYRHTVLSDLLRAVF